MTTGDRYRQLRDILNRRQCFKLVCGAGNEDAQEVKRLATVYTLAGATILDISANIDVVKAAEAGVEAAYELASSLKRKIGLRPFLNVSIGLKGDPHVRKASIERKLCTGCGKCITACRQGAIGADFVVDKKRCIGCGCCEAACAFGAVRFFCKKADFNRILPECRELGVETMELHAVIEDDDSVLRDWRVLNNVVYENFLSMCLDRSLLSNKHLIERVKRAYEITGDRLIIQADGVPMSGEGDGYNTTLQAIACADIVRKSGLPIMVLLSGGTNSKTGLLAQRCGVDANGVAIGTFARTIVSEFIKKSDFDSDKNNLKNAVSLAEKLIKSNIEAISG